MDYKGDFDLKKLLIVNDLIYGGGVEKLMYDLVMAWKDKYKITIMSRAYEPAFYDKYPKEIDYFSELRRHELHGRNLASKFIKKGIRFLHYQRVKMRVKKDKYDVMLVMKEGMMLKNCLRYSVPLKYAWNHTDYNSSYYTKVHFGSAEAEVEAMRKYQNIICVAQDIKKGIIDVIGDPGNLIVKYNPINIEYILEKAKEPVVDMDLFDMEDPQRPIRFVSVGRLNKQKGYPMLVEACGALEEEGYNFEIIVIGPQEEWSKEEYNSIQSALDRTKATRIKFVGSRENPYKYMAIADWFISSSLYEGYSLVSQEAALLDIPLMLTDCSGVRELLGDNEYGIVIQKTVYGIYKAMKKALDDPKMHDHYKRKISERKEIISYEKRIKEIESLFA